MKRDMELVRDILVEVTDSDFPLEAGVFVDGGHDFQTVAYHFDIMKQAGLLDATVRKELGGAYVFAEAAALTWEGQDFLAAVRSRDVWKKVKSTIAKRAGDAAFSVFKTLAVKYAEEHLIG